MDDYSICLLRHNTNVVLHLYMTPTINNNENNNNKTIIKHCVLFALWYNSFDRHPLTIRVVNRHRQVLHTLENLRIILLLVAALLFYYVLDFLSVSDVIIFNT